MDEENTAEKSVKKSDNKKPKLDPLRDRYPRDFIEYKPYMPSLMSKNSPRNILKAEKFFNDYLNSTGEFHSDYFRQGLKYCTGCESFYRDRVDGFEVHPEDEAITLDELYHDYGVRCPKTLLSWAEENLTYQPNHMPNISYIRLPGYERYHYTYSELAKGYSIQDKALLRGEPLDHDKLGLEQLVISYNVRDEKTTVDLNNVLFGPPTSAELGSE